MFSLKSMTKLEDLTVFFSSDPDGGAWRVFGTLSGVLSHANFRTTLIHMETNQVIYDNRSVEEVFYLVSSTSPLTLVFFMKNVGMQARWMKPFFMK